MPVTNKEPAGKLRESRQCSREDRIITDLRRRIVAGRWKPGMRLPLRVQIEKEFDAAPQTVQRAMSRLINDGFIVPHGRLGTFAAAKPPHLHRYGVVFNTNPRAPVAWNKQPFQEFLYRELVAMQSRHERDIVFYFDVGGHTDDKDFRRLADDIHNERLAGVVFFAQASLDDWPLLSLLDTPGMPFVTISMRRPHTNLSLVSLNYYQFIERALDYMQERKLRRVAILGLSDYDLLVRFKRDVARRRMVTRPYWMLPVPGLRPEFSRSYAHLLMKATDVPDVLIITDDTLVEYATAGLVDAGVRVPRDLEVVAHCNFPSVTPSMVPAKRLGFDVRQVLNTCLGVIDRRRRHEFVPPKTEVHPLFDSEVERLRPTNGNDNHGHVLPVSVLRCVGKK
jgi:hypothetical protein